MKTRNTIVVKNCPATQAGGLTDSSGMTCQTAHTTPNIRPVVSALHRSCRGGAAYPIQPTSSQTAGRKNTTKKIGIVDQGIKGSGSRRPRSSMTPNDSTMIRGIKSMMGTYQSLCLILFRSKALFKSLL